MLIALHHLAGVKGDVQQIFAQGAGEGLAQRGQQLFTLRLAQDPQGLVELGDDLPLFIDIAAPDPGDAAFIRPEPAAQFGDFFFVHQKPSFVSGDIGAARRPLS